MFRTQLMSPYVLPEFHRRACDAPAYRDNDLFSSHAELVSAAFLPVNHITISQFTSLVIQYQAAWRLEHFPQACPDSKANTTHTTIHHINNHNSQLCHNKEICQNDRSQIKQLSRAYRKSNAKK